FGHGLFINSSGYWIKGFTPEQEWGFMDKNQTVENAKFQDMFPDAWKIVNTKNYGQLYTEKGLFTFQDVSPLRNDQIPEKDILEGTESTIKQDKNKLTWKVVTFVSADVLREVQRKPIAVYLVIYISCLILLAAIVWGWRTRQKHEYTRKQYGTLLKVISQPIFTINLDGVFLFLNAVFSDQLSGSPSDFIGKNLWDVFAEDEASNLLSDLREASTKRLLLLLSKELTINNGKTRWYNVRVQPYSEKKDIYDKILVILTDITKQKQAEEALRESQHRLATHIELTPIGVIEFNRNYEVYSWNPAAKSIFGYTEEETKSRNLIDLVIPEYEIERVTKIYQLETSELIGSYIDNKTKDGRIITCQWFNTPLFNRAGKLVGTAAVCQDVTDQLKAEKVLRDSKEVLESAVRKRTKELEEATKLAESANRAKTEFLENMSHELRTPMHGILSFSKFGIEKFDKTSKEKKLGYFKTINQSGKRLMYLLDNLLDLSKLEAEKEVFKMQSVNIGQLINNAVIETETISQEKKMKVVVKEPLVPSKNICDVYKIGQVISNLLDNALKFTPENRQITISYDSGPLVSQRWLTNKETMSATIVSVKDEGVGVPNGELESIFDKFIQSSKTKTGAGGTGLGLAICKEIIKAHKGIIWAENNLDGGSIFSFVLPCELEIVPEHIND
ncbi:MAG: PAS domain S-box protein, partial [Deltaproteobacteria bacterium]|nr:PAS domain S-box protein [Deltaproteobacteria bacterium]